VSEAMYEPMAATASALLTRRAFARIVAVVGAAFAFAPYKIVPAEAMPSCARRAVVSFHMDQLYVDRSGTAVPYHPPLGARSGQVVADLTEEAFRRSCLYA